jgi:hypothetical protein
MTLHSSTTPPDPHTAVCANPTRLQHTMCTCANTDPDTCRCQQYARCFVTHKTHRHHNQQTPTHTSVVRRTWATSWLPTSSAHQAPLPKAARTLVPPVSDIPRLRACPASGGSTVTKVKLCTVLETLPEGCSTGHCQLRTKIQQVSRIVSVVPASVAGPADGAEANPEPPT